MHRNTPLHVLVGSLVAVVLFGVPGGPVLGGIVTGYLESGGRRRAASLGVVVGGCAAAVVGLGYVLLSRLLAPGLDPRLLPSFLDLVGGFVLLAVVYAVVASVLGSLLGDYLAASRRATQGVTP